MRIEYFILDLDNTLYGYDKPHKRALKSVLSSFSSEFEIPFEKAMATFNEARKNTQLDLPNRAASHNRVLYFQKMLELNGLNSLKYALKLYDTYWNTFLDNMAVFNRVTEFLEMHTSQGCKFCILTDLTAHIQFRKIQKLNLSQYIDYLVTSEEVGVEKPDALMFEKALEKLRCSANEALMIGDNWEKDILGATAKGIRSIWINHDKKSRDIPSGVTAVEAFEQISL